MDHASDRTVSHRWIFFVVAFVLLCFYGLIYAWSLFIEPIEADLGWQRSQTSMIFTISCITVCLGMIVSGVLETRFNFRFILGVAALMILVGFIGASFCQTLLEIFTFYGVFVGLGVGVAFNCSINAALKWFPDKQGRTSGALLMGYGGGAMLLSPLVTSILEVLDWRMTFALLGVVFAVIIIAGAFVLRLPTKQQVEPLMEKARANDIVSAQDFGPLEIVKMPIFWMCFVWLMLCTSGGLGLVSQAVPAAMEVLDPTGGQYESALATATFAMGSVSLCNGLGRLINGFVWDKFGYRVSLLWISMAFMLGTLFCGLGLANGSLGLLVVGFALVGLTFGGTMSTTSAVVGTFFGTRHFGINYAIMCCQMIPAAIIGPTLLAMTQTSSGSYQQAFWIFLGIAVVTFASSFAIKRPKSSLNHAEREEVVAREAPRSLQPDFS